MAVYRARVHQTVHVESLGRDVTLDPAVPLDDQFPEDAAVIAEWAKRGVVRLDNPVESATAAPGEQRNTRRTK